MLKNRLLLGAACAATLFGLGAPAVAQDQSIPETVVVTGSRLGTAGLNAPTPVTAVSAQDLQASAPSTIADALNNLPSLVQSGGQQNNSGSTSAGKNLLNLRGLGTTRTLILLDGMRFPSTSNTNAVDTNVLPQALVKRVDIVTGGASASYGSDAVAGAVNFVLDDHYTGIGVNFSSGVSQYGDNLELHGTGTFGTDMFAGRMHLIANVDYFDNFGAAGDSRPFRRVDPNAITTSATSTSYIFIPDLRTVGSFGGYVVSATAATSIAAASRTANQTALTGLQFDNGGNLVPYNPGTNNNGSFQSGGDGVNTAVTQDVSRPLRRRSAFLRDEFRITDDISFYVEGIYGHSDAEQNDGEFATGANAVAIHSDNPYLSAASAARVGALLGVTTPGATGGAGLGGGLSITKYFPYDPSTNPTANTIEYKNNDRTTTQVAAAGFDGALGQFEWGVSANYGYTREYTSTTNSLNLVNLKLAADATTNPNTGQIVCRDTLINPNDGCVPIDLFGTNNLTPAAINYITDHNPVFYDNLTSGGEAHINGPLFDLPAGPVSGALGGEFRRQRDVVLAGVNDANKVYQLGTVGVWQGGYDVTEGFTEIGIPLLKDMNLVKSLDANVAARITNYSSSGLAVTWKAGLVWKVSDPFLVRATVSRDIRAPNPNDLFSGGSQGTTNVTDPFNSNVADKGIRQVTIGNPLLKPERGTTITAGVTYTPEFIPGLSLTADYYDIRVAGVIAAPTTQNVINFCFQGNTFYCQFIQRNPPAPGAALGVITGVTVSSQNLNAQRTNGVDLEANYAVPADDWFSWWQGNLSLHTVANYLGINTTNVAGSLPTYAAGSLSAGSGEPHIRDQTTINYDIDQWSTYVQIRYIGPALWNAQYNNPLYNNPFTTTNFNHVNTATYFDTQETFHINPNMNVYLNIQNLFNLQPQFSFANSNYAQTTDEALYDQVGRMFRIGIRIKY